MLYDPEALTLAAPSAHQLKQQGIENS